MSDKNNESMQNPLKITKDQWPMILKLATVVLVGILFMNFASFFKPLKSQGNVSDVEPGGKRLQVNNIISDEIKLEKRLENILGQINGAGQVAVTVIIAEGPTYEYAVNVSTTAKEMEEKDQAGGVRTTTERTEKGEVVMTRSNNQPVLLKESMAKIQGVLVVAGGASNPHVKEKLFKSVQTLLQLPAHKITICSKEGR